jgi:hypothetical protein
MNTGGENTMYNLDQLLNEPQQLGERTPEEWYTFLANNGCEPMPLGRGALENLPFESGGGYRVHWGGDKYFQYHPAERSHHDDEYYKMSSGVDGIRWFDMKGNLTRSKGGQRDE